MTDKCRSACFTGHRAIPDADLSPLRSALYSTVAALILEGCTNFVCGGAMGFDTLAAECVINLRKRFPHIRLILILPCRNQTEKWVSGENLIRYKSILGEADTIEYIRDFYSDGCMQERNRRMVDLSDVCVAYMKRARGGTAHTFKYASGRGLRLINLSDAFENSAYQLTLPNQ